MKTTFIPAQKEKKPWGTNKSKPSKTWLWVNKIHPIVKRIFLRKGETSCAKCGACQPPLGIDFAHSKKHPQWLDPRDAVRVARYAITHATCQTTKPSRLTNGKWKLKATYRIGAGA